MIVREGCAWSCDACGTDVDTRTGINMRRWSSLRAVATALLASGCIAIVVTPAAAQTKNPLRDAYFGETHVHTSWSLDAWLLGNRLTGPADAYKYFKGEPIKHPMGYEVKISTPLDWATRPRCSSTPALPSTSSPATATERSPRWRTPA